MTDPNNWRQCLKEGDTIVLRRDDGSYEERTVRSEPWMLYSGVWIVGLNGISGGYALDRVVSLVRKRIIHDDTASPVCPQCGSVMGDGELALDSDVACDCGCHYSTSRKVTVKYTTRIKS